MGLPVPRAISLGEELSSLTRDDRARLDQILWILGNDLRRDPSDLLSHAATRALPRVPVDGGMHKAFITAIKQSTDKHLRRAGQRLADLHCHRVDADYNLARPISRMDVAEARHAANAVRSLVAESATLA